MVAKVSASDEGRTMNDDIKSVIRARDQLASMYADSESRLTAALNDLESAFAGGYDAGWDLGHAKALGAKTEFDPRGGFIEWNAEDRALRRQ
jgi:hypothetical protein